jgi:pimeloyl-ACP methyl ester carboxylesterase/predicted glycosyltransferase
VTRASRTVSERHQADGEPGASDPRAPLHEQSRARYPDESGYLERDGVQLYYEVYGSGERTVFLLPTWSIVHSRHWKMQIPYLSRHFRVLTFDGRGNGRSDRPISGYDEVDFAADALAVMDATATDRAALVSLSLGAQRALILAAEHPERVEAAVFICPAVPFGGPTTGRGMQSWGEELDTEEGWAKYNRHYWLRDYQGFLEFFFSQMFNEPHSTKPIEDCVGWGLETTPQTLIATQLGDSLDEETARKLSAQLSCPVLVIQGTADAITGKHRGVALAEATSGELVLLEGSGHGPHVRDPLRVNILLRDFLTTPSPKTRRWIRGASRRKRALYISSPIGLGHAKRDVAIADELRKLYPDLEVDWLAQHPVTEVLRVRGERVHPASGFLANESAHVESESAEHDLHCFQAIRRMDEILFANFMVFHDLIRDEDYDLWIGDECWELDYYLHENPEQKRAAYVWLTDFVGWLPMPDGGQKEAVLTADYNAEMIGHIGRYPRVRDRAIFVGNPDDIVPDSFGPDLPLIRDWTRDHYAFSGYVTGFDPADFADRARLRQELGYRDDERICVVTVGGSGVGGHLLRRVVDSFPLAKQLIPDLRMVVVAGPRIDPTTLPGAEGLEVRAFVPDLYRHLAACDMAVVQGGLTTVMELTTNNRPFLYFPLHNHFEQNFHVRYRLDRYGAGRCMDFASDGPEQIATAIAAEIGRGVSYRPVETDGAAKAASSIAELL